MEMRIDTLTAEPVIALVRAHLNDMARGVSMHWV